MAKRIRPRPNQVTVDMSPDTRKKFNEIIEAIRKTPTGGPFFSQSQLLKDWVDATYQQIYYKQNKNNSSN